MRQVSFEEIGAVVATFECGKVVVAGDMVKMSGNGEVSPCVADEAFCGVALSDSAEYVGVQVKGFVEVKTEANLALGYTALAADGEGGVIAKTGGVVRLVVSVDTGEKTAIICL